MQTHKYQFPLKNKAVSNPVLTARVLENELNDSPDCLGAWCLFPSDSKILDHAAFEQDGNFCVLNLYTYTKLWENAEKDLRACVEENLHKTDRALALDGDVVYLGRTGNIPNTLYHITDRENLDVIREKGLVPNIGPNNYKNMDAYVNLTSEKDLHVWLSVLKNIKTPVILEIDAGLCGAVETGRVFEDREYANGTYAEYRTQKAISPSAIQEADLALSASLRQDLVDQLAEHIIYRNTDDPLEVQETNTYAERLTRMGLIPKEAYDALMSETALVDIKPTEPGNDDQIPEGPPWNEEKTGLAEDEEWRPVKPGESPWDEDYEDNFIKNIETMSKQNSIENEA